MVTAVDSGAIGAACDVEQTATEVTAATAIAIDTVFMLSLPGQKSLHNCDRTGPQMNGS